MMLLFRIWLVCNLLIHDDSVGKVDENEKFTALNAGKIVVIAMVKGSDMNYGGEIKAESLLLSKRYKWKPGYPTSS